MSIHWNVMSLILSTIMVNYQYSVFTKGDSFAMLDNMSVTAVLEHEAQLPCDIRPLNDSDKAHLIFWYRETSGSPFYSLDVRNKSLSSAKPVFSKGLKKRFTFNTHKDPAYLLIHRLRESDEGIYRCRVDFRSSPTRYFSVNLTVIIPPLLPVILDQNGVELVSTTESYNEASNLFISCESKTGKPNPILLWRRDDVLVDDTYYTTPLGTVRNDLTATALSREDFGTTYTCQATNNNLSAPMQRSIIVNMNLKPLQVKIKEERRSLSAGRRYELKCRSYGSRPPPVIAWWMGDKRLKTTQETVSADGNISTSVLTFQPTHSDNGKYLSCRAENPTILNSGIEDGWTLDIFFVPIATLELGRSLKDKSIYEGDDVYFECHVSANPFVHAVRWKFRSKYLLTNSSAGVIVSKLSLVIRSVNRDNVGSYTCIAINKEGDGESNAYYLQIRRLPYCQKGQKLTYGVARNEAARISCQVDAFPEKITFNWAFNNSFGENKLYNASTTELTRSTFLHLPRSEKDFGTFYCWGTNEIGPQLEPCTFRVVTVEIPDPVTDCTVYNQTLTSFYIECLAGHNGGLPQEFILDIFDMFNKKLRSALVSPRPLFYVSGLQGEMSLQLHVYASNSKGRSDVTEVSAATLKPFDEKEDGDIFSKVPLLGILSGVVAVLLFLSIAILWVMKCRGVQSNKRRDFPSQQIERKEVDVENDEKCPDVIPSKNGKEHSVFHINVDQEFPPVDIKCLRRKIDNEMSPQHLNQFCIHSTTPQQNAFIGHLLNHLAWENSYKVKPYTKDGQWSTEGEGMNLQYLSSPISLHSDQKIARNVTSDQQYASS